jgi:hypothetical protein
MAKTGSRAHAIFNWKTTCLPVPVVHAAQRVRVVVSLAQLAPALGPAVLTLQQQELPLPLGLHGSMLTACTLRLAVKTMTARVHAAQSVRKAAKHASC